MSSEHERCLEVPYSATLPFTAYIDGCQGVDS